MGMLKVLKKCLHTFIRVLNYYFFQSVLLRLPYLLKFDKIKIIWKNQVNTITIVLLLSYNTILNFLSNLWLAVF